MSENNNNNKEEDSILEDVELGTTTKFLEPKTEAKSMEKLTKTNAIDDSDDDSHIQIPSKIGFIFEKIKRNCWLFPLLLVILIPLNCFLTWTLAIYYETIYPILPYVSDAAGRSPPAGYFSQLIDCLALLGGITIWFRYKQIKYYLDEQLNENKRIFNDEKKLFKTIERLSQYNFFSTALFYVSVFGFFIVGNFRSTENLIGHSLGATMGFGLGLLYMIFQVFLCFRLTGLFGVESRPISMLITVIVITISLNLCLLFMLLSACGQIWTVLTDPEFRLKWSPNEPGYLWHCLSSAFEWIFILLISFFFMCFYQRFRSFGHKWNKIQF